MPSLLLILFISLFASAGTLPAAMDYSRSEKIFNFVMEKMSAPLQGVDELEDSDIFDVLPIGFEALPANSKGRSWLKKYAMTSYGSQMFSLLLNDFNSAVSHGYLSSGGALTRSGKQAIKSQAWKGPFVIARSANQSAGSPHSIQIPENYDPHFFPVGGEAVDPLALIHHEFGHTHFSSVISENREHLEIERDVVRLYENPIRLLNSFPPRKIYFDSFNTMSIPSGNIYPGPAFIFFNLQGEFANPYFFDSTPDGIKIVRDSNGNGVVNDAAFLKPIHTVRRN